MPIKKRLFLATLFFLFLSSTWIGLSFWTASTYSNRINEKLKQFNEQKKTFIHFKNINYRPWQGKIVIDGIKIKASSVLIFQAKQIQISIPFPALWKDNIKLPPILVKNATIIVDAQILSDWDRLFLELRNAFGIEKLDIQKGIFRLMRDDTPVEACGFLGELPFSQANIDFTDKENISLFSYGQIDKGDWSFSGLFNINQSLLSGEYGYNNLPSQKIYQALTCDSKDTFITGTMSGALNIHYRLDGIPEVHGSIKLGRGELLSSGFKLRWKSAHANNIYFNSHSSCWQGDDLLLDSSYIYFMDNFCPELLLTQGDKETINFSTIEAKNTTITWVNRELLTNRLIKGDLCLTRTLTLLYYKINGLLTPENSKLIAEGEITLNDQPIEHTMNWLITKMPIGQYSLLKKIGHYSVEGGKASVHFTGLSSGEQIKGKAQLSVKLPAMGQFGDNNLHHQRVLALMADSKNTINTTVFIDGNAEKTSLVELLTKPLAHQWDEIGFAPFHYLSRLDGIMSQVEASIAFQPGEYMPDALLLNQIQALVLILKQRPLLKIAIEGHASKAEDAAFFSKSELNQALQETYTSKQKPEPSKRSSTRKALTLLPNDTREDLIEQMYCHVHPQKSPSIPCKSKKEHVKKAEQWLLDNWPIDSDSLLELAEDRADNIMEALIHGGIEAERIRLLPPKIESTGLKSLLILEI